MQKGGIMRTFTSNLKKKLGLLAISFIAILLVISVFADSAKVAAATITYSVTGYVQNDLIYNYINRDRQGGDGYWIDNTGKHPVGRIYALKTDSDLEEIAKRRAAELAFSYSNTRPNRTSFTTCRSNSMYTEQEFIYKTKESYTAEQMYNIWFQVGSGPAGAAMMSTSFKTASCVCCEYNGTYYWVLEFTRADGRDNSSHIRLSWNKSFTIDYDSNYFTPRYETILDRNNTLTVAFGSTVTTPIEHFSDEYRGEIKVGTVGWSTLTSTWSTNSSNCIIDYQGNNVASVYCTKIGTYTLTGIFKQNGKELFRKNVTIICKAANISDVNYSYMPATTNNIGNFQYTGSAVLPNETIFKCGKITLVKGTHFTVTGTSNNINLSTGSTSAKYTIKGDGVNIIGSRTFTYSIVPKDISSFDCDVTNYSSQTYTGSPVTINPTVTCAGKVLVKDRDYTLSFSNNINVDPNHTAVCTITGKGNYTGTTYAYYSINPKRLNTNSITAIPDQIYNGTALTPSITVKDGTKTLTKGTDYSVSYSNNNAIGRAKVTVTFTGNYGGTLTVYFNIINAPNPVTPTPVPSTGLEGFIVRLYTKTMNRIPETNEINYWVGSADQGMTGADIARNFLMSPEFVNTNRTNSEFVGILYNVFFDRTGNSTELAYWSNLISGGTSKTDIVNGFINSIEWEDICASYGISSGSTRVPPTDLVRAFATRLYTTCLARDGEPDGINYWTDVLSGGNATGTEAARSFFFGGEFTSQNISNEEYVARLYRTFMGREADSDGLNYWVTKLQNGSSRESVFNGFATSAEFITLCNQAGIRP